MLLVPLRTTNPDSAFVVDIQINVGKLDPVSGTFTGESDVYALAGYLRGRVSDSHVERSKPFWKRSFQPSVVFSVHQIGLHCCEADTCNPSTSRDEHPRQVAKYSLSHRGRCRDFCVLS